MQFALVVAVLECSFLHGSQVILGVIITFAYIQTLPPTIVFLLFKNIIVQT
jgi:ABC-type glycerol-3-phosphate transport system permease component